jgi:hypothetical protein
METLALSVAYEWQQCNVARAFDCAGQLALFAFRQTGLFACLNLAVLVNVALQGLKILIVKIRYVCSMLKYLCHLKSP